MRGKLADLFAPHYCCSCGEIGSPLCNRCMYDIVNDGTSQCMACLKPTARFGDICKECTVPYSRGWFAGMHGSALRQLINYFKFKNMRHAAYFLAKLLDATLPDLPATVTVVPVPTVPSHIRQRGYDHALLIAKHFARMRGLGCSADLLRRGITTQRGANRSIRDQQAAQAFACTKRLQGTYLLIDDVSTTGATLKYAAKALRSAGAEEVWVAAVSREPLD